MKKNIKRIVSLAMCAVLLIGVMGVSAFAVNSEDYTELPYTCYTYLGDSIPWGYGLDPNIASGEALSVDTRVEGSYTDIVGSVLEENNGATVNPGACSGSRLSDYRTLLETGMGVENPYTHESDWYGSRHPERSAALYAKAGQICDYIRESDLVTVQVGLNDITGALVNTACATGLIDINKLKSISDAESVLDYIVGALENVSQDPDILGNVITTFSNEIMGLRENVEEITKDVVALAPDDADIVLVGYYHAVDGICVIPGTDFSFICDLIDTALVSLNDYYSAVAEEYDNVYYVEAPDASVFYTDGTTLSDMLSNIDGVLMGIHADAAGHEYIAQCVLDGLKEINTCRHEHTKVVYERTKATRGYGYVGVTVCTDCGKVVSMGKIITPFGSFDVPENTVQYIINRVENSVNCTVSRVIKLFNK